MTRAEQLGLPGVTRTIRGALTLGIDEAGRGPVLGPMVLAAVALDAGAARALTRAGVCDSKQLGAGAAAIARRAELAAFIRGRAPHVALCVVDAAEIDARVERNELNLLERERACVLIDGAPGCARIIADGARMFAPLRERYPGLRAYDRGESRHVAVAAASIIAKDERDRQFATIAARYRDEFGELTGGGYFTPPTTAFLDAYWARHRALPPEARRTWTRGRYSPEARHTARSRSRKNVER